jgi:hypothetical protein
MYESTLRSPRARSRSRICRTHFSMLSGVDRTLVTVGGPGGIGLPSGSMPLPAFFSSGAVAFCGPNTETGNEYDVLSFATQSSIGSVSAVLTPRRMFSLMNGSRAEPGLVPPAFLKNQSFPAL